MRCIKRQGFDNRRVAFGLVGALAVEDAAQGLVRPHHFADALSTDSGPPSAPGR